ncbi:MAG: sensor domain-containing diguanylate cyclase [Campylobacterales bacterium]|nr:sensor domain-containing diguanylate cyclase [Campylobacterales bacterium]
MQEGTIELEQLLEAGRKIHLTLFGNLILGLCILIVIGNALPPILLTGWVLLLILPLLLRVALMLTYQKATPETLTQWQRYFIIASFLTGLFWGIAAIIVELYAPAIYQGFIAFIVGGLAAAGIVTSSSIRWNYPAFILPMLLSLACFDFYQNDTPHLLMATAIIIFTIIMLSSAIGFRKLQFEKYKMLQMLRASYDELQISEQQMKDITNSMGEGLFVFDTSGELIFLNAEGERLLGWSLQELLEDKQEICYKIHSQENGLDMKKHLIQKVLVYGETLRVSNQQFKRKDGTLFSVSLTAAPIHSKDGIESKGVVIVFEDLTVKNHLEKLAFHDALTGLYNRGDFDKKLQEELNRALRYETSLSLLMLDIDFFKNINDTYGHQAGDEVLKSIATIILTSIRNNDYGARYGGEEFIVILPETNTTEAIVLAERIKETIEKNEFNLSNDTAIHLTISIGVASSTKGISPEYLLEVADNALYKAKENGRNQVWFDPS